MTFLMEWKGLLELVNVLAQLVVAATFIGYFLAKLIGWLIARYSSLG